MDEADDIVWRNGTVLGQDREPTYNAEFCFPLPSKQSKRVKDTPVHSRQSEEGRKGPQNPIATEPLSFLYGKVAIS